MLFGCLGFIFLGFHGGFCFGLYWAFILGFIGLLFVVLFEFDLVSSWLRFGYLFVGSMWVPCVSYLAFIWLLFDLYLASIWVLFGFGLASMWL